ncbi:MAG: hypothetical protein M3Q07_26225 [Pseudobdellovibrionaceae bacterium]|nr:hypothetical protein [Pseudobdellovibrionaceae bacterium]
MRGDKNGRQMHVLSAMTLGDAQPLGDKVRRKLFSPEFKRYYDPVMQTYSGLNF